MDVTGRGNEAKPAPQHPIPQQGTIMALQPLTLSVVAPCFNEEAVLPEFLRRTRAACEATGLDWEIVVVDDGSRDRTWSLISAAAAEDTRIRGLRLRRNHGHQLALTAGLHTALGERVLAIDADLQDPPELIPEMLRLMEADGADVVYGQRQRRAGETVVKRLTAHVFYRLIRALSDVDIPPDSGDFRLMRREVVDILRQMPERHRFIRGMVAWIGGRQIPLSYDRDPRFAGETKYPFRRMLRFALDAMTGFSRRPLALATHFGLLASVLSFGLTLWSVIGWAIGITVPGWASLMAAFGFFTALQLFVLGLLGEYIGRLYEASRERPLFLPGMTTGQGLAGAAQAASTAARAERVAQQAR